MKHSKFSFTNKATFKNIFFLCTLCSLFWKQRCTGFLSVQAYLKTWVILVFFFWWYGKSKASKPYTILVYPEKYSYQPMKLFINQLFCNFIHFQRIRLIQSVDLKKWGSQKSNLFQRTKNLRPKKVMIYGKTNLIGIVCRWPMKQTRPTCSSHVGQIWFLKGKNYVLL